MRHRTLARPVEILLRLSGSEKDYTSRGDEAFRAVLPQVADALRYVKYMVVGPALLSDAPVIVYGYVLNAAGVDRQKIVRYPLA